MTNKRDALIAWNIAQAKKRLLERDKKFRKMVNKIRKFMNPNYRFSYLKKPNPS